LMTCIWFKRRTSRHIQDSVWARSREEFSKVISLA
jgi:hypothetical protein